MPVSRHAARFLGGNRMLEMTNENFARLLRGLTIAVGNRRNRILLYQFLAAEIRALHCSYGVGDGEYYKRALTFLENCERYTLRSLVRRSAKHHAEATVDHANCFPESSLSTTGECVVINTCSGGRDSFAPSEPSSRMIRCGSRPCSVSSIKRMLLSDAALRWRPAMSSRVEPTPRPRSGIPSSSCSEIVPPMNDTARAATI